MDNRRNVVIAVVAAVVVLVVGYLLIGGDGAEVTEQPEATATE